MKDSQDGSNGGRLKSGDWGLGNRRQAASAWETTHEGVSGD